MTPSKPLTPTELDELRKSWARHLWSACTDPGHVSVVRLLATLDATQAVEPRPINRVAFQEALRVTPGHWLDQDFPERFEREYRAALLATADKPLTDFDLRPAIHAAGAILDRPYADPDDDAALVARAVLRLAADKPLTGRDETAVPPLRDDELVMAWRVAHGYSPSAASSWDVDLERARLFLAGLPSTTPTAPALDVERLARILGDGDPNWQGYVKEATRIIAALSAPVTTEHVSGEAGHAVGWPKDCPTCAAAFASPTTDTPE